MENKLSMNESIAIIILQFILTLSSMCVVYIAMSIGLAIFNIMEWNLWARIAFLFTSFMSYCFWFKIMKQVHKEMANDEK